MLKMTCMLNFYTLKNSDPTTPSISVGVALTRKNFTGQLRLKFKCTICVSPTMELHPPLIADSPLKILHLATPWCIGQEFEEAVNEEYYIIV